MLNEIPLSFSVHDAWLYGVLHKPIKHEQETQSGVLIVVGGPQTRIGSHRQFVLLARALANAGIPVMRFDYRGMGDSQGDIRTFESINADINTAINTFEKECPYIERFVLWGLCDAASASAFYACQDKRVSGLVLLNPWVRTEAGIAKTYLKNYYISRLFSRQFWVKVFSGNFNLAQSLLSLFSLIRTMLVGNKNKKEALDKQSNQISATDSHLNTSAPLPERMYMGLKKFKGNILFILSGNDFTADEFRSVINESKRWKALLATKNVTKHELRDANHTFSRRIWRDQVANWTVEWVKSS